MWLYWRLLNWFAQRTICRDLSGFIVSILVGLNHQFVRLLWQQHYLEYIFGNLFHAQSVHPDLRQLEQVILWKCKDAWQQTCGQRARQTWGCSWASRTWGWTWPESWWCRHSGKTRSKCTSFGLSSRSFCCSCQLRIFVEGSQRQICRLPSFRSRNEFEQFLQAVQLPWLP